MNQEPSPELSFPPLPSGPFDWVDTDAREEAPPVEAEEPESRYEALVRSLRYGTAAPAAYLLGFFLLVLVAASVYSNIVLDVSGEVQTVRYVVPWFGLLAPLLAGLVVLVAAAPGRTRAVSLAVAAAVLSAGVWALLQNSWTSQDWRWLANQDQMQAVYFATVFGTAAGLTAGWLLGRSRWASTIAVTSLLSGLAVAGLTYLLDNYQGSGGVPVVRALVGTFGTALPQCVLVALFCWFAVWLDRWLSPAEELAVDDIPPADEAVAQDR